MEILKIMNFDRQSKYCFIAIVLSLFLSLGTSAYAGMNLINAGAGDDIDKEIYTILDSKFGDRVELIPILQGDHIVRVKFSYGGKLAKLADNVVLISTVDRTFDQVSGKTIANVIQIRFFPNLQPIDPSQEVEFFTGVMSWQYNKIVPQLIYLTPKKELAYGWNIPVYAGAPISPETIISVVEDLAKSWEGLYDFFSTRIDLEEKVAVRQSMSSDTKSIVHFLPGNKLTEAGIKELKIFSEKAKQSQGKIIVKGYVSSDNASKENEEISLVRANKIREMLISEGIDDARIETIGMGIKNPLATNKTREGRNENRRAELVLSN